MKSTIEIADQFGVTAHTVSRWANNGKVSAQKFAGVWVFDERAESEIRGLVLMNQRMTKPRRNDYDVAPESRLSEFVPIADACAAVDRSEQQVRRWMKAGRLQGYRREGRQDVMLLRADVEAIAARIAAGDSPFPAEAKAA